MTSLNSHPSNGLKRKRIVLFTSSHLDYCSRILDPLLKERGRDISHVFISQSLFNIAFYKKRAWFFIKNRYPFCISLGDLLGYLKWTWQGRQNRYGHRSVMEFVKSHQIPCSYVQDINSEETRKKMKELDADIFIFCLFDKIAKAPFLAIPHLGTYNVHIGKMPEYRGGLCAFWALRFGDEEAGSTFHEAIPKIDAGKIITERRFSITTSSMKALMEKTIDETAPMILEGLEKVEAGNLLPLSTEGRKEGYYFLPTKEDFAAFYRRGCRLI
jgi:folate-dependent phosphoribosylglycinamide formyltransferase PurN